MRLEEITLRWEDTGWTVYDLGPATAVKAAGWSTRLGGDDLSEVLVFLFRNCRSITILPPLTERPA